MDDDLLNGIRGKVNEVEKRRKAISQIVSERIANVADDLERRRLEF